MSNKKETFWRNVFIVLMAIVCGLCIWLVRALTGIDLPAPV